MQHDTIAAIATAPGRGGVGIVRISGPLSLSIAKKILHKDLKARHAVYTNFIHSDGSVLDQGIALYFQGPHSFTGEDVVELQGHGGPVIMDMLLALVNQHGARLARPGEFSERAFLNDKLDLTQAEAIADLINASSVQAAKQAVSSLQGNFSRYISELVAQLIQLRVYVESAIDFPEEEIDFLSDGKVAEQLDSIIQQTDKVLDQAQQGALVSEGMKVVIAGKPNAGKSSLLNALAQKDVAIVTDIEGTTRDTLEQQIHIDGMPLHIIDTAGLRDSDDHVEKIGIARAWKSIDEADRILLLIDSTDPEQLAVHDYWPAFINNSDYRAKLTVLYNKIDRSGFTLDAVNIQHDLTQLPAIAISAKEHLGFEKLTEHLKSVMGYHNVGGGGFSARRRHLVAIGRARDYLLNGQSQLHHHAAGELLAEDLRSAQHYLSEVTGEFSSDDLLGEIFSSFCIGK